MLDNVIKFGKCMHVQRIKKYFEVIYYLFQGLTRVETNVSTEFQVRLTD